MATAVITLEDKEDGTCKVVTCYGEGFQVESNAHQCALLLIKHMNQIAEPQGEEVIWGDAPSAQTPIAKGVAEIGNGQVQG